MEDMLIFCIATSFRGTVEDLSFLAILVPNVYEIEQCRLSSYKNTIVGETMIRELETRGELLNEAKKTYEEKLEIEAKARREEHSKAEASF